MELTQEPMPSPRSPERYCGDVTATRASIVAQQRHPVSLEVAELPELLAHLIRKLHRRRRLSDEDIAPVALFL